MNGDIESMQVKVSTEYIKLLSWLDRLTQIIIIVIYEKIPIERWRIWGAYPKAPAALPEEQQRKCDGMNYAVPRRHD